MIEQGKSSKSIVNTFQETGEYSQDVLIERKPVPKIQKFLYLINSYSRFNSTVLEKLGILLRKHHMFYGISLKEKALENSLISIKVMIFLLLKKDLFSKFNQINENAQNTIG